MSRGLGKGLSALIAEKPVLAVVPVNEGGAEGTRESLPVADIQAGVFQPRRYFNENELVELSESIKRNGVVQPIIVRSHENKYEIIAGERRWRAAKMAGLKHIPAIIMEMDDRRALEIAIVENVQRQDLKILEVAEGYQRLLEEFSYTQEQLSEVIGKSRSQVTNTLRLIALPERIKQWLNEEKFSFGHARALLTAESPEKVAQEVMKKGLNVRQTEQLVKRLADVKNSGGQPVRTKPSEKDPEITLLEKEISQKSGFQVSIIPSVSQENGMVSLRYGSMEELGRILSRLEDTS